MAGSTAENIRIEKHSPDGGWGYLIILGMALTLASAWGSFGSVGFLFNDFILSKGGETEAITIIIGVYSIAMSFAGLFASVSFKKYSIRCVGLVGSCSYFLGSLLTIFVTSITQLIISFGLLQGFGTGVMIPVAYTAFNEYFVKRRVVMMSVTQSIMSIGIMLYPLLIEVLMDKYGFRGAFAIIAAINSHAIFGMLLMHPVRWHYRVIKIPIDDINKPPDNEIKLVITTEISDNDSGSLSSDEEELSNDCLIKSTVELGHPDERSPHLIADEKINELCLQTRYNKWQQIVKFLDLTLLKDLTYVNIALGVTFVTFSDGTFFILLPMYLFKLEFSKINAATVASIASASDLIGRITLAVLSCFISINARYVFLAGAILQIILRFVFLNLYDFMGIAMITAALGLLRSFVQVPLPLVFADHLSKERFASGFGLFMFLQGILSFFLGPLIGWIRDATQSYEIGFLSLSFILGLCAVPWLMEILWLRFQSARRENNRTQ